MQIYEDGEGCKDIQEANAAFGPTFGAIGDLVCAFAGMLVLTCTTLFSTSTGGDVVLETGLHEIEAESDVDQDESTPGATMRFMPSRNSTLVLRGI